MENSTLGVCFRVKSTKIKTLIHFTKKKKTFGKFETLVYLHGLNHQHNVSTVHISVKAISKEQFDNESTGLLPLDLMYVYLHLLENNNPILTYNGSEELRGQAQKITP